MKTFMDKDFLLETETAKELFHETAEKLPIIDYHCHLVPREIAEDIRFENLTQMWLLGDHYKWRFMRSMGVDEKYCTGDASDYEKFKKYTEVIGYAIGNPLYHWTHLELQRFFGITTPLSADTADEIWNKTAEMLKSPEYSAKNLIRRSNVEVICTTDDPADDLKWHKKIAEDTDFHTRVLPTFRPDSVVHMQKDGFVGAIKRLGDAAGIEIRHFDDLKQALKERLSYFLSLGCRVSDHSLTTAVYAPASDDEVDAIFTSALSGEKQSAENILKYQTAVMLCLGELYAKNNMAMQLHFGALRNNNTNKFNTLGADTGFDSIDDLNMAQPLSRFLDALEQKNALPKTILYTLNPKDNYVLCAMLGNFQQAGIKGKIQFGSGWWFNDQIDGMTKQMTDLANLGALSAFVGMLTDSRSLTSYPRHEYFRRILCNLIGSWVEDGKFPHDMKVLSRIVGDISYHNAKNYFGF